MAWAPSRLKNLVCGRGATGAPWEGLFPRYVWYKDSDKVFEGRLVNRSSGSYKGYLLDSREWPSPAVVPSKKRRSHRLRCAPGDQGTNA